MTEPRLRAPRVSREMRLLILTIVVSGAVLLLLARLRFPAPPPAVDTLSQPLQRLAARASFEDLSARVSRFEADVFPHLVVLRLALAAEPSPVRLRDVISGTRVPQTAVEHVPALRVGAGEALAVLPANATVAGIVGQQGPVEVMAVDEVTRISRLRVPEGAARAFPLVSLPALRTPAYVVAVEGTRAGLTLRPVFIGRSEGFESDRWRAPLLPLGGAAVAPGALLFTLEGELLGCAVLEDGTPVIASASDFFAALGDAAGNSRGLVDPGLSVQPLASAFTDALGVSRGVVVAEVAADGPASGRLQPGDVITHLDGLPVSEPTAFLLELGVRLSARPVEVSFVRLLESLTTSLERRPAGDGLPAEGAPAPPAELEILRGVGTRVVAVSAASPLARAGLARDDVVVRLGQVEAPTPAQIRAQAEASRTDPVVLVFTRSGRQHVTVIGPPARSGDETP